MLHIAHTLRANSKHLKQPRVANDRAGGDRAGGDRGGAGAAELAPLPLDFRVALGEAFARHDDGKGSIAMASLPEALRSAGLSSTPAALRLLLKEPLDATRRMEWRAAPTRHPPPSRLPTHRLVSALLHLS